MCRLGGVVLTNRMRSVERYNQIAEDLLMLLVNMERALGGDGNSLAFHYPNGDVRIIKDHRKANRLFHRYNEIVQNLQDGAIIVQMHARLSTCGPSKYHENMHPFEHGAIVGCHNGQIDDQPIWDMLERVGVFPYSTTDSEAIFAALDTFAPSLHPTGIQEVLDMLDGTYAITAVSRKQPNTLFLLAGENPLCYWLDAKRGEFWYASTPNLLPESLEIPKVKKKRKTWDWKKKAYVESTVAERDVVELDYGDGIYVRVDRKKITIEKKDFYITPAKKYGYGYGYKAWDWDYYDIDHGAYDAWTEEDELAYLDELVQGNKKAER